MISAGNTFTLGGMNPFAGGILGAPAISPNAIPEDVEPKTIPAHSGARTILHSGRKPAQISYAQTGAFDRFAERTAGTMDRWEASLKQGALALIDLGRELGIDSETYVYTLPLLSALVATAILNLGSMTTLYAMAAGFRRPKKSDGGTYKRWLALQMNDDPQEPAQPEPAQPEIAAPQQRPKPIIVGLPLPDKEDLAAIEAAILEIYNAWPKVDGKIDTGPLRERKNLAYPIEFRDGRLNLESLLVRHRKAIGTKVTGVPARPATQPYLLWAFRRVSGNEALSSTSIAREPTKTIKVKIPKLDSWTTLEGSGRVLKQVISANTISSADVPNYWVLNTSTGEKRHLQDILLDHWHKLRPQLVARRIIDESVSRHSSRASVLDIIHYNLLHRPRPQTGTGEEIKKLHKLIFKPARPLPDPETLEGALQIAFAIANTDFVGNSNSFPRDESREHRFFHHQSGQFVRYSSFIASLNQMIAEAKTKGDLRFAEVTTSDAIGALNEPTRRSILAFVRKYKGNIPNSRVVRRRDGVITPVFTSAP